VGLEDVDSGAEDAATPVRAWIRTVREPS
jgi:hypothetical protein